MTLKEKAIVYLDGLTHLEYKHKRSIIDLYDDIGTLFENPSICYEYLLNNASESYAKTFIDGFKRKIYENIISEIENSGYIVVTEQSKLYPTSLLNIDFRPLCLYCLGNVNLLSVKNKFSIVGSRKTLPEYLKYTTNIAGELSNSGVVIVTGVANGADKSAILGA
ncbi:MAG: DNA-processing protein DprA, partial [Clostridia bacterium]|nr:DNA-processing protein DprA [Clostridia bacterium]